MNMRDHSQFKILRPPPSPDSSLENADVEIVLQKKGEERVVNLGTTEPEVIQESSGAADELPQPAASPQEPITVTQQAATTSSTGVQTLSQDLDEPTDSDDTGDTDEVEVVRVLVAGDAGAGELERLQKKSSQRPMSMRLKYSFIFCKDQGFQMQPSQLKPGMKYWRQIQSTRRRQFRHSC